MKKPEIARRIARRSGLTSAEAADQLDRVVREILSNLRRGQAADLPGLGRFRPTPGGVIRFEQEDESRD
jgi:nucleoid DNA-binding protein